MRRKKPGIVFPAILLVSLLLLIPGVAVSQSIVPVDGSLACLLNVCKTGDIKELRRALTRGIDLNRGDASGCTPLMMAARHGHEPLVDLLIRSGAEVDARDEEGNTALLKVVDQPHCCPVVKTLLKHGANPRATNFNGENATALAQRSGKPEMTKLLKGAMQTDHEWSTCVKDLLRCLVQD